MYDRIKNLREDSDYSQRQLAGMLFINRSTYSAYENGANAWPLDIIIKLAEIYKTNTDYLLGLTDNSIYFKNM